MEEPKENDGVEEVAPQPRVEAEQAFARRRRDQDAKGLRIPDDAIRKDRIARGPGGKC